MAASAEKEMIEKIAALAPGAVAIIISDYGKGTISPAVFRAALHWGKSLNIPVFVDPKGRDYSRYHGATALTPNLREAGEAVGTDLQGAGEQQFLQAAKSIIQTTGCKWLIITRGGDGLSLFETGAEQTVRIAASSREVFDVTGAGDTFVAWLAAGTCAGLAPEEASRLANAAAGIAVSRSGVAVVSPWEVRGALIPSGLGRKLIAPGALQTLGEELHRQNKKIVFTNGCFDFLHAGHVAFLQQAREMGDVLVLGMNDDPGIGRLKGPMRPIIGQQQREVLLASIEAVDYLVPFSEDTPDVLIKALRPDLLVKGGNYEVGGVQGADIVLAYGGRVATLPIVHEVSTGRLAPILRKQS
jgi:D-beta-D-heptose 7-phosphate kinase/D-beta-D-heptose 1-phosphate adenosyltransferase